MKDKKKLGIILGAVAAVILLAVGVMVLGKGKSKGDPEIPEITAEEAEKMLAEAFTKTIHDFPGHLIDNLDDQDHTNFVVYAKDVKRVTTDGESNVILHVDLEKLQYTISHPDEQITSLQEGDVFFMDPSVYYGPGISVKVESMEVQEDQVVITGGEMTMEELIEYADVDMVISPEEILVSVTEDDSDIAYEAQEDWQLDISDEEIQLMMAELQSGDRLWEKEEGNSTEGESVAGTPGSQGATESTQGGGSSSGDVAGSIADWMDDVYEAISVSSEVDVPDVYLAGSIGFNHGNFSAKGSAQFKASGIHVIFRYTRLVKIWKFGIICDMSTSIKANLEGRLSGNWPLLPEQTGIIPLAGPIMVTFNYQPTVDASVSLGMSAGASKTYQVNTTVYVFKGIPWFEDCTVNTLKPDVNYSFVDINGRLAWNMMDASAQLGIPLVGGIKVGVKGGLEVKGTLQKPEWTGDGGETVHDCEVCVKGNANPFVRADVSVDIAKMLGKKFDPYKKNESDKGSVVDKDNSSDKKDNSNDKNDPNKADDSGKGIDLGSLKWTFLDMVFALDSPYDKFYVSFMQDQDPEFDFGECPHRRWRTDVTVLKEGTREPVPEEIVEVTWSDGNVEYEVTDEDGKLTIYLPKGDNLLSAEEEESHLRGKAHAVIEDEPIEVELLLGGGNLHIIFADQEQDPVIDNHDTNSWYELQEKLINMYPEAQWHHGFKLDELFADEKVSQGDIVVDITYDAPHTKYGQWNDDYLEDGDNSNIWGEGGGWIYAEISRICKDQDSGDLIPKYTFGISVSYDPARKAYLRNPQITTAQYIIQITQDVSGIYNDEYLLIGYGSREEGRETWTQDTKYIHTDYKYDTDAIRGGSRERHHLPSLVEEYLPQFVEAMMDQWDLDQIMVAW